MTPHSPVIALGLDSAEGSVVERLLDEGRLPNLSALRARGVHGRVRAEPDGFLSMVWPTLLTGQSIGAHGWYFNKLWSHEEQRLRYLDASWIPSRAIWAPASGRRSSTCPSRRGRLPSSTACS
jgi:predicted AlkP superfamily phosphohydrolase/phosphomutase